MALTPRLHILQIGIVMLLIIQYGETLLSDNTTTSDITQQATLTSATVSIKASTSATTLTGTSLSTETITPVMTTLTTTTTTTPTTTTTTPSPPTTTPIVCKTITAPTNGTLNTTGGSYGIDTVATFGCDDGYNLIGTTTIICTTKGTWNGSTPQCQLKVHNYNESCLQSGPEDQCSTKGASCLPEGEDNICRCTDQDYFYQANDSCYKLHNYNESCLQSGPEDQCSTKGASCLPEGEDNICRCTDQDYFYQANNSCYKLHNYNESCLQSGPEDQCSTKGASCLPEGEDNICRCTDQDYFNQANDSCYKLHNYNESCLQSGPEDQCSTKGASCLPEGEDNICRCTDQDYFNQANDSCYKLHNYNESCLQSGPEDQCSTKGASCLPEGEDNICRCTDQDYFNQANDSCYKLHNYNESCLQSGPEDQCSTKGASCLPEGEDNICRCTDQDYFNQANDSCYKLHNYNESCLQSGPEDQCSTKGASCLPEGEDNICRCTDQDYFNQANDSCYKLHNYNESCLQSGPEDQCSTKGASCLPEGEDNICRCTDQDYFNKANDSCYKRPKPPTNITVKVSSSSTTQLIVSWNGFKKKGFRVVIDWKSSLNDTLQSDNFTWNTIDNYHIFMGLRSGTNYTFFLYLEWNSIRTVLLDSESAFTKPEPVEKIWFEDILEKSLTVTWTNDASRPCQSYTISLNDTQTVTINRNGNSTQDVTFSSLASGTSYEVTIITNVPGQSSEAVINTSYTRPKPVDNATVIAIQARSITLQLTAHINTHKDEYHIYVSSAINLEKEYKASTKDTVEIDGLEPGTQYNFTIYTYYNNLESERYLTVEEFTRPLPPDSLTGMNVSEDSLELQWEMNLSYSCDGFVLEYTLLELEGGNITYNINDRSISNYSIQNLTSGTGYIFYLYSVINVTKSGQPATYIVYTRPEGPEEPTLIQQLDTSITIQFPSDNSSYNGFRINGNFYDRGNGTITISDLHPGWDYTFIIYTVANYTMTSLSNTTFVSFTRPTLPATASFPNGSLNETSLTVMWENITIGSVDGYIVYLTNGNFNESVNASSDTAASFTNLTSGEQYTAAIYSYWKGIFSYGSLDVATYTRPPAPEGSISNVTETNLTLTFTGKLWNAYMIKRTPGEDSDTQNFTNPNDEQPYVIDSLIPGTNYTLDIYSIVGGVIGVNSLVVSSYTKPERVRADTIVANKVLTSSSVLAIKWNKTTEGSVDWYEMQFKCTSPNDHESLALNDTSPFDDTTYSVSGLDPGTFCTVNIIPHAGDQQGALTRKDIEWSTDENAPEKVQNVTVVTEARSLNVIWENPVKPNGIIRKYFINIVDLKRNCIRSRTTYTCNGCKNSSNTICGQDGTQVPTMTLCHNDSKETEEKFEQSEQYEHYVPDLHPYRNYMVVITPFSRCNGNTESITKLTQQAAPTGAPINVTKSIDETTSDIIRFSWFPPDEDVQNGIITNYTVYYTYTNKTCFDKEGVDVYKNFSVNSGIGGALITASLPDLYSYWSYNINVTAWTTVGEGPQTSTVQMMTNQSRPGVIRTNPQTTNHSSSSIHLSWEPPCRANGIIDHYRIHVIDVNSSVSVRNYTTESNIKSDIIDDLDPYHNYTLSVAAVNTVKQEGPALNTSDVVRTSTGVPLQPTNVKATAVSSNKLRITWTQPSLYTGITMYSVTAQDVNESSQHHTVITGWDFNKNEVNIDGLDEYWFYKVTVIAITSAGSNASIRSSETRTKEAAPGNVNSLNLTTERNVTRPRSIKVTWRKPDYRDLNGILTSYFVHYTSSIDRTSLTKRLDSNISDVIIKDIKPGSYNVSVFAATSAGNGTRVKQVIVVPPGAPIRKPEKPTNPLMKESQAGTVDDDTTQIAVEIPLSFLCDDTNGEPVSYGLIIAAEDQAKDNQFAGSKKEFDEKMNTTYKTWFQVRDQEKPMPYITTRAGWKPPCPSMTVSVNKNHLQLSEQKRRRRRSITATTATFTIGQDGDCSGIATNTCNGKLKPDTSYRVKSFSCTVGGCSETLYSQAISTKPEVPVAAIVGSVASVVVISLIVVGVVIYLKRRRSACFAKSEESGTTHTRPDSIPGTEMVSTASSSKAFRHYPVQLSEFPDYVDKMKKDSGLVFADAYRMLRENSPAQPMTRAESQNCRPKNRYTNILPYDHSRVKLLPLDDEDDTDYINASYIPGYTSRREYIATQGPMPATFDDFWRMVWEQNVEIVVMLTKLIEKGRNKCDKYWPNQNEPQFYGDLSVSVMSESNLSDYTIRIMEVKLGYKLRKVKHFHFLKWPDYGCPSRTWPIINFIAMVRQYRPPFSSGPLLVHCSAGVGRTGTFIAVDHLLQHIRDHDEVDIYALVAEMRKNRCNMVQTEDQYIYIHECIREFISNDEDEDEDDDDDDHLYANSQQENVYENTGFSKQL